MQRANFVGMLLVVSVFAGCGSSGGGIGDQFCHDYAAAYCHKLWQCPQPGMSPPGSSEAECTAGFAKLCTDQPPPGQTNDVSCVGATHVNTAARTSCLDEINSATCDDINSALFLDGTACSQVCVKGATGVGGMNGGGVGGMNGGGTGGMNGGGTGGMNGGGTGGISGLVPNTGAVAFCVNQVTIDCALAFQCTSAADRDANFVASFGTSVPQCQSMLDNLLCTSATCASFSMPNADACISQESVASCAQFLLGNPPVVCSTVGC